MQDDVAEDVVDDVADDGAHPGRGQREVWVHQDGDLVVVHQAYSPAIAEPALAAGRFVPPFSRSRMTWIKPSLLWAAYRSGWARKPDQERVLAISIPRQALLDALGQAALSHHVPTVHGDREQWRAQLDASPVRVQWDPERDLHLRPLLHRCLQVGLGPAVVSAYVDEWTVRIEDRTALVHRVQELVRRGADDEAAALLPHEQLLPLPEDVRARIGATR